MEIINLLEWMFGTTNFVFFLSVGILTGYLCGIHNFGVILVRPIKILLGRYLEPFTLRKPIEDKREIAHTYLFLVLSILYVLLYRTNSEIDHLVTFNLLSLGGGYLCGVVFGAFNAEIGSPYHPIEKWVIHHIGTITRSRSTAHLSYLYGFVGIFLGGMILRQEAMLTNQVIIRTFMVSLSFALFTLFFLITAKKGVVIYNKKERMFELILLLLGITASIVLSVIEENPHNTNNAVLGVAYLSLGMIFIIQSVVIDIATKEKLAKTSEN